MNQLINSYLLIAACALFFVISLFLFIKVIQLKKRATTPNTDNAISNNEDTTSMNKEKTEKIEFPISENLRLKLTQARVQGHSHKKMEPAIPCQDAGKGGILSNGFPYIIVSDGAGSSKQSHIASDFCVNRLFFHLESIDFKELQLKEDHQEEIKAKWHNIVKTLFEHTRNDLLELSLNDSIPTSDLYCTLLMIIKTDWGFLSANIGDGRTGVSNGRPNPLSVPLQTFTAGATFFLIKEGWENVYRSYITPVQEPESIKYFFATTDGCQDFVMDWSQKGPRKGIYDQLLGDEARYDLNIPYEPFFDGLIASLNEVDSEEERNLRLQNLIEKGIYVLNGEEKELTTLSSPLLDDDKTFILFHN